MKTTSEKANILTLLAVVCLAWCLVFSVATEAMSGSPAEHFVCDSPTTFNNFTKVVCRVDHAPYVTPMASGSIASHPVAFIYPTNPTAPLKIKVKLSGYNARPVDFCDSDNSFSDPGYVVIKPCAGHYPDIALYKVNGIEQQGWWGYFNEGLSNHWRLGLALTQVYSLGVEIDHAAGVMVGGSSYGGTGAIMAPMGLSQADPWWSNRVTVIRADVPTTRTLADAYPTNGQIRAAWGPNPGKVFDFNWMAALDVYKYKYLRINGSTVDPSVIFNPAIFDECDLRKVACFGTYHAWIDENGNPQHAAAEPGINLPFSALYPGPGMDIRLNAPMVVFTNSSANHRGARGHHNLGLAWQPATDTPQQLSVPIRYKPVVSIGGGVPDQPPVVVVDITIKRARQFDLQPGTEVAWQWGTQSGLATATVEGEITIGGVTLAGGDSFVDMVLTTGQVPLVYTRIPAANDPIPGTPLQSAGLWQFVTDVSRVNGDFQAGASVVLDWRNGTEPIVIHGECSNPDPAKKGEYCTAQEARVSPDGRHVVYSVSYSNNIYEVQGWSTPYKVGIYNLGGLSRAELWIYTIANGQKRRLTTGHIDRQPEFLNNNTLVISSNRANLWTPKAQYTYHQRADQCVWPCTQKSSHFATQVMQIWQLDINTGAAWNMTPQEVMALSPTVTTRGDVLFSSNQAYGQNTVGKTPLNEYWICRVQGNGADQTCVLNAHGSPTLHHDKYLPNNWGGTHGLDEFRGIRCMAEIYKGIIAGSNYYRGNHGGCFGVVYSYENTDPRVEGASKMANIPAAMQWQNANQMGSGRYVPSTLKNRTPGGQGRDDEIKYMKNATGGKGMPFGKWGYPAPYPGEGYLMTWAKGECYIDGSKRTHLKCHKVPVVAKVDQITDPTDTSQMQVLIDDPKYQIWDARPVVEYRQLYGQDLPYQYPAVNRVDQCFLNVVDMRDAELFPHKPNYKPIDLCQTQGCAIQPGTGYFADNVHALTIYQYEHWNTPTTRQNQNNIGWKSIAKIAETPINSDGSVKQRVPCGEPIITLATDKNGMVIARNDMPHGVYGEQTCHGCHGVHSEESRKQVTGTAEKRFSGTIAATKPAAQYHAPHRLTFRDVEQTVNKCATCHADETSPAVKNPQTGERYLYSWFAWNHLTINRPNQSDMVSKFALNSPGYIHCEETPTHQTGATAQDCSRLGNWIDQGAQK